MSVNYNTMMTHLRARLLLVGYYWVIIICRSSQIPIFPFYFLVYPGSCLLGDRVSAQRPPATKTMWADFLPELCYVIQMVSSNHESPRVVLGVGSELIAGADHVSLRDRRNARCTCVLPSLPGYRNKWSCGKPANEHVTQRIRGVAAGNVYIGITLGNP